MTKLQKEEATEIAEWENELRASVFFAKDTESTILNWS